jgi:predicted enzyme related to lactoylglutathione lyase
MKLSINLTIVAIFCIISGGNMAKAGENTQDSSYKKVTGIGGIFFKCKNPTEMRRWYAENLGLATNEYGSMFEFRLSDEPEKKGYLQWSPFEQKTKYFEPSEKEFMINYRVDNIERLVDDLKKAGVQILDEIESFDYGKFVHIMDPDGNKIELWQPVDDAFTEPNDGENTK